MGEYTECLFKMLLKELDAESPAKAAKKRHHKHKRRPPRIDRRRRLPIMITAS